MDARQAESVPEPELEVPAWQLGGFQIRETGTERCRTDVWNKVMLARLGGQSRCGKQEADQPRTKEPEGEHKESIVRLGGCTGMLNGT
jgi:hypothetical protein